MVAGVFVEVVVEQRNTVHKDFKISRVGNWFGYDTCSIEFVHQKRFLNIKA